MMMMMTARGRGAARWGSGGLTFARGSLDLQGEDRDSGQWLGNAVRSDKQKRAKAWPVTRRTPVCDKPNTKSVGNPMEEEAA